MHTADFNFDLPPELIAQSPAAQRDASRLLILRRETGGIAHSRFRDLPRFLKPGDLLIFNNSRVLKARLRGHNAKTGGTFEMLLLECGGVNRWWVMLKPGKRARIGTVIQMRSPGGGSSTIRATVTAINAEGHRELHFEGTPDILSELEHLGEVPLPPYIRRDASAGQSAEKAGVDNERYQTIFADPVGSVAAPTAGLHFTPELFKALREAGVETQFITLHVGLGTFAPVKAANLSHHVMHEERFEVSSAAAQAVNRAKAEGRRVIAIGTTSVRVLESVAQPTGASSTGAPRFHIPAGAGRTKIFIHPPYQFKIVDALLTNFHLPCSTLLMLVSAFARPGTLEGREIVLAAYASAVRERYRFFSYGDAMLIP